MKKIKIKSLFGNWHYVNKTQAKEYVYYLLKNITNIKGQELINYIEHSRLRNITINELLK